MNEWEVMLLVIDGILEFSYGFKDNHIIFAGADFNRMPSVKDFRYCR